MRNVLIVVCAANLLTGCAVREANQRVFMDQRPLTASERATIAREVRSTFFDPYSVRDAEISNAAPVADITLNMTNTVCVLANAKNRLGGYTGKIATIYYLSLDGRILRTDEDGWSFCGSPKLRYDPFPEIENIDAKRDGAAAVRR